MGQWPIWRMAATDKAATWPALLRFRAINELGSGATAWGKIIEKPYTIAMNVIAKTAIFDQNSFCDGFPRLGANPAKTCNRWRVRAY